MRLHNILYCEKQPLCTAVSDDLQQFLGDHHFAALPSLDVRRSWIQALEQALHSIEAELDTRVTNAALEVHVDITLKHG